MNWVHGSSIETWKQTAWIIHLLDCFQITKSKQKLKLREHRVSTSTMEDFHTQCNSTDILLENSKIHVSFTEKIETTKDC